MKNKIYIVAVALFAVAFTMQSCEEVGPNIDLGCGNEPLLDTTYVESTVETPQTKVVVIEEWTGVRCSNCPTGHVEVVDIKAANPNRVIGISLHSNFLADPYPTSTQDLRPIFGGNNIADAINSEYGPISSKPQAFIDRAIIAPSTSIPASLANWSPFTSTRLAEATPVNIHLESMYDDATRVARIRVTLHYTQAVSGSQKFTVCLIENGIVSTQLMPTTGEKRESYVHNEVLRDFVTNITGSTISANKEPGRVIINDFEYTLPMLWNADEVEIVAFVHNSGTNDEIVHGEHIDVK